MGAVEGKNTLDLVLVVKSSACSPSTPTIRFESRWVYSFYSVKLFGKDENKLKSGRECPIKKLI